MYHFRGSHLQEFFNSDSNRKFADVECESPVENFYLKNGNGQRADLFFLESTTLICIQCVSVDCGSAIQCLLSH